MKANLFDYFLPQNLIAQKPANPRDSSRLLVLDRNKGEISHHIFRDIVKFLNKGDVLVFNDTKVFPARIMAKKETGGKIEILFLEEISPQIWQVLTKPAVKKGKKIIFKNKTFECVESGLRTLVKTDMDKEKLLPFLKKFGKTPLPPYIKNGQKESYLRRVYQTVYAQKEGSAAAPTAGFHFTQSLIEKIKNKGVKIEFVTLHVGLDTFVPIKTENLEDHKMHSEYFEIKKETIKNLLEAKSKGKRIIAVGTTTVRALETLASDKVRPCQGKTDIFIYPPYKFKLTDALITNFHLPKSTLLALVSAFTSYPQTKDKFKSFQKSLIGKAYKEAVKENYRFYSFGDACLIL
ncbi:MAG: S-adenosylmethionine:tRNA ribosyltransferase-isomerase [Patescibacteria group bacterium]|nr:MAG: S-adenosylmethionine:tRNA ribosyltransferase-isomerase [Patescibacteria group bacterium]